MWLPTKKDFLFSCQLQLAESAHKSIALFSEGTLHLKYEKFVQKKSHPAPPFQISGHRHHCRHSTPRTTIKNHVTEKEHFFLPYQNGENEQMPDLSRVWNGEQ
jgi:hypothetical protein